jgi:hypothetical protein
MKRLRLLVRFVVKVALLILQLHRYLQSTPKGRALEAALIQKAREGGRTAGKFLVNVKSFRIRCQKNAESSDT